MPSTQPLCEGLLSAEAAEAATSCAWQRQLKSKAKSSPWWFPCGTGPSKAQQPQAGHPLLTLPLLIGNPSSVSRPSPQLVTRIQRPAASYIQTFVAPKGKAMHSIEELMAFQRVPSCHTTVHKPKQHTIEQPVHIQLLTNRVRKRRKMSCEIHICWKRDSYHIVSFSVKTAATLLLECVCLHSKQLRPGGEVLHTPEKSFYLGAAHLSEDESWNYLQKSCSARQAAAAGDEVICTRDSPKAKQQNNTCPSQEGSPLQSCTCSGLCPDTA